MSIVITSGVKLENIQNRVVMGRKLEACNFAQAEKFALNEFSRSVRIFTHARNLHSARNCSALLASCTSGFLHFCLPNFEEDQSRSFMHGLTRQNRYQMLVKTTKIATECDQ